MVCLLYYILPSLSDVAFEQYGLFRPSNSQLKFMNEIQHRLFCITFGAPLCVEHDLFRLLDIFGWRQHFVNFINETDLVVIIQPPVSGVSTFVISNAKYKNIGYVWYMDRKNSANYRAAHATEGLQEISTPLAKARLYGFSTRLERSKTQFIFQTKSSGVLHVLSGIANMNTYHVKDHYLSSYKETIEMLEEYPSGIIPQY